MGSEGAGARSSPAEFEAAVFPHLEGMARCARFLMRGNRADAEDLVQDAALRAFEAFPRFQPGTNLQAWLFRILRNAYVDWVRKRGRETELAESLETVLEIDSALDDFRAQATRERTAADLETALTRLPAELQMALLLVDGEGMRYDGVAEIMECPVGTLRSRLHRGRRLLRQQLLEIWRSRASRSAVPGLSIIGPGKEVLRMRTTHFKIPTVTCEGCVEAIRTALSKHPGVQTIEGDPIRKEVVVTFNPGQITESEIRAAIAGARFVVG